MKIHPENEDNVTFPSDLLVEDVRYKVVDIGQRIYSKLLPLRVSGNVEQSNAEFMEYCIDLAWLFFSFRDQEIQNAINKEKVIQENLTVSLTEWRTLRDMAEESYLELCLHHYNGADFTISEACKIASAEAVNYLFNCFEVFDSLSEKQRTQIDREKKYGRLTLIKK